MTYRTTGADRSWQFRPSDHCRDEGLRRHIHGPIVGMGDCRASRVTALAPYGLSRVPRLRRSRSSTIARLAATAALICACVAPWLYLIAILGEK